MSDNSLSKLQFYSLGLVAANKSLKTDKIEVTPVEDFSMVNGEITDNKFKYVTKTKDADGAASNVQIDTTITVQAMWLPIGQSNRKTSPDVRRGEQVILYKFADADKYYWTSLFNDARIRRLETVIYAFSNNSKEDIVDDQNSTYYLEVSTHQKTVTFHTSKNDGEPFAYDVQVNAKEGKIIITDDVGNFFVMDSANKRLSLKNSNDSLIDIDRTNILIKAMDSVTIVTNNYNVVAGAEASITSPITKVVGKAEVSDTLKAAGRVTMSSGFGATNGGSGASTLSGNLAVTQNISGGTGTFTGNITAPNI